MNLYNKTKDLPVFKQINWFLYSKIHIVFFGILVFLCSSFSLELVLYPVIAALVLYLSLFSKDMYPLIPIIMFGYFTPSIGNNPGMSSESIFYPQNGLWIIVGIFAFLILCLIIRIILYEKASFFKQKRKFLIGIILVAIGFALGGIGNSEYISNNIVYCILLILSLFFFYYYFTGTVKWEEVKKSSIAYLGLVLGLIVSFELAYIYLTNDVIVNGVIERNNIISGWGICNNIGLFIALGIPFASYLSMTRKYGFIYALIADFFLLATIFSCSRGSILTAVVLYLAQFICSFVFMKKRLSNFIQTMVVHIIIFLSVGILFIFAKEDILLIFDNLVERGLNSDERIAIYLEGLNQYKDSPVFGKGFFACTVGDRTGSLTASFEILPGRWHNTIIQVMASTGTVGLIGYLYHRVETVYVFFKEKSMFKTYIFIAILGILFASLVDCHLFNLGPGLIYSCLLCFLEKDNVLLD